MPKARIRGEQGSHRLEKYLILKGFLEKSLKINLPRKVLENHSKALKRPCILLFSVGLSTVDKDLNQHKIVVPTFGSAYAAQHKIVVPLFGAAYAYIGTTILH